MNPYEVLGLSKTATDADIRSAFKALAMKYHPDRNHDNPEAVRLFKQVSAAYEILSDPDKRRIYNGSIDDLTEDSLLDAFRRAFGGADDNSGREGIFKRKRGGV